MKPKGKMKIFAVNNGNSESDFDLHDDFYVGGSNAHSGGLVIIAENMEEAQKLMNKIISENNSYVDEKQGGTLIEIPMKRGIVLFANGDC